ncbi:MAG: hypothetical protein WC590_12415, partial [Burkholderiaceae bacterium]
MQHKSRPLHKQLSAFYYKIKGFQRSNGLAFERPNPFTVVAEDQTAPTESTGADAWRPTQLNQTDLAKEAA